MDMSNCMWKRIIMKFCMEGNVCTFIFGDAILIFMKEKIHKYW